MLKVTNLTKGFKDKDVLQNLNIELDNGIYGFLGPNGAGKTTFIRCICGVYKTKAGVCTLDEASVGSKEYVNLLGYLPQNFGLFRDMKVYNALEYMAFLKNIKKEKHKEEIESVLKRVNLEDKASSKVKSLSGGMLRRLGIAQALLGNPRLLVLDEPTAGLDPEERMRFKKIISGLEKDKIVLISTHICSDVESLCDKVIIINNGTILYNGNIEGVEEKACKYEGDNTDASELERGYLCVLKQ